MLTPCMALRMEIEKLCTTAIVIVDSRKKPKHHQTTGSFMKAMLCSAGLSACCTTARVLSLSRCETSSSRMHRYSSAAAR